MTTQPTHKKNKATNLILRPFLHYLRSYNLAFPMLWLCNNKDMTRGYFTVEGRKGKELEYAISVTYSNAIRRIHTAYDAYAEMNPDALPYWAALGKMNYQEFISLVESAIDLPAEHCDDRPTTSVN